MSERRAPDIAVCPDPGEKFAQAVVARAARRAWIWETVLLSAVLLCTFSLNCFPLEDTDVWWHLKTGQLILDGRGIPFNDWFTYTNPDKKWTDLHWGFQILIALLHAVGGIDLLTLVKAVCLTLAVMIGWKAAGDDLPAWAKALCWTLPMLCFLERAWIRPEMLTLVFLALWLYIDQRVERHPKLIWWLPVIQLVWTNCHALFVLGFVVGGFYAIDRLIREAGEGDWGLEPRPKSPGLQSLLLVAVLTVMASLLNPYAEEGLLFPLELYRKFSVDRDFYSIRVLEFEPLFALWRRVGFNGHRSLCLWAELLLFASTAASFVLLAWENRWHPRRWLLFVAFSYLAWTAVRNINLFGLVSGVLLCANLSDVIRLRNQRRQVPGFSTSDAEQMKRMLGRLRRTQLTAFLFAGWIIAVVTGEWSQWSGTGLKFGLGEIKNAYIHKAAQFAGQPGFPMRAFVADWGQAAVYIFHHGPERTVFMDGRLEVNGIDTYLRYDQIVLAMAAGDPSWQFQLLDNGGSFPVVILDAVKSRKEIQGVYNTPGWRLVYADRAAAVFLDHATADRLKLPPADPQRFVDGD